MAHSAARCSTRATTSSYAMGRKAPYEVRMGSYVSCPDSQGPWVGRFAQVHVSLVHSTIGSLRSSCHSFIRSSEEAA